MKTTGVSPTKFLSAIAFVALLSLGGSTVWADTISFDLNGGNGALVPYPAPYATVTVNRTSTTTATITFDALTNATYEYLLGDGGTVAVNVNGSYTLGTITGTQPTGFGPTTFSNGGAGNEDVHAPERLRDAAEGGPDAGRLLQLDRQRERPAPQPLDLADDLVGPAPVPSV